LRNEFTFYDNKDVELGSTRNNIIKFMGKEYWVKMGLKSCAYTETSLNTDYRMEVDGNPVALSKHIEVDGKAKSPLKSCLD